MNVFLDTSYFIARLMPRDQWHRAAQRAAAPGLVFITSAPVINEAVSLLQSRGFLSAALAFLEGLRTGGQVRILYPDAATHSLAWDLFHRLSGSGANATDCTSFALMRELGIRKAFTFDQHFREAGFEILDAP